MTPLLSGSFLASGRIRWNDSFHISLGLTRVLSIGRRFAVTTIIAMLLLTS